MSNKASKVLIKTQNAIERIITSEPSD